MQGGKKKVCKATQSLFARNQEEHFELISISNCAHGCSKLCLGTPGSCASKKAQEAEVDGFFSSQLQKVKALFTVSHNAESALDHGVQFVNFKTISKKQAQDLTHFTHLSNEISWSNTS